MKIAIDIDDTLNVIERARYAGAYIEKEGLPFHVTDPFANAFVRVCDWREEDVIRFIGAGGAAAFIEALPREGAQKTLRRWKEAGHTIVILTARLKSWFGDPYAISYEWLKRYNFPFDELVADCEEKGKYCKEHKVGVLIDDNLTHCRSAKEHGVTPVLAVCKATEAFRGEFEYVGEDWEGIAACVAKIAERKGERA